MVAQIVTLLVSLLFAVLLTWFLTHRAAERRSRMEVEQMKTLCDERIKTEQSIAATKVEAAEKRNQELKEGFESTLKEIKENHKEALREQSDAYRRQSDALKAEMLAKTEEILKQRQVELDKKAKETFETITGNLGKDLKDMKTAFEENKTAAGKDSADMKARFEEAVKQLSEQTKNIGSKADHLAEAMRGRKKMQGCWGETILQNLLDAEGLVEGRDYDKEVTLRDELGIVLLNEDTEKRMRPDYLLHFVDNQDVVVDSKVSLSAYADYDEDAPEQVKKEVMERNLAAFKEQVRNLSSKRYTDYLKPGRRMVDYVIMFVPVYPALQLAYMLEPGLWQWAYSQKVLITSSETLMPFLRTILLAWRNVEQVKNQQKIIEAAQNMIDRVADFASSMQTVGKKLSEARDAYEAADKKLKNSGQGILVSAHKIVKLGGVAPRSKKVLPEADAVSDIQLQFPDSDAADDAQPQLQLSPAPSESPDA